MSFDAIAAYKALAAEGFTFLALQKGKKWEFSDKPENEGKYCYRPELTRKFATSNVDEFLAKFSVPEFNYGVLVPEGWVVIDVDTKNNGDIQPLIDELGSLPAFYTQTTVSGGKHFFCKTSAKLVGKIEPYKGIEFCGEGSKIVLAPSKIDTGSELHYTQRSNYSASFNANESPFLNADWNRDIREFVRALEDKDKAHQSAFELRQTLNAGLPKATEECQAKYLDKVANAIEERITSAVQGERFETLRASAVDVGQYVDYWDVNEKAFWLEQLTNDWPNLNKRRGLIASGIEWGIAHKRDLSYLVDYSAFSKAKLLVELHEKNIEVQSWANSFVVSDGTKVKGVRVRAVYQTFINQAKKAKKLRFNLSQYQIIDELMLKDRKTIRKAIEILVSELKVIRKVETEKEKTQTLPDWMLAQTFELTEVALQGETLVQSNDDYFNRLMGVGFFKQGVMPPSAELVLRVLKVAPATTTELVEKTKLSKATIKRLLDACASVKLVVRGKKAQGHKLAENFVEVCEAIIDANELDEKAGARKALTKIRLENARQDFEDRKDIGAYSNAFISMVNNVRYATAEELELAEQAELVLVEQ